MQRNRWQAAAFLEMIVTLAGATLKQFRSFRVLTGVLAFCSALTSVSAAKDVTLQISAHQDDDILFMNPDFRNSAGLTSTTAIFVTAGEAQGAPGQTREEFAASRQEGSRVAYASMYGATNSWTQSVCSFRGVYFEVDKLQGALDVNLVFLHLPDGGDGIDINTPDPYRTNILISLFNNSNPFPPFPLFTHTIVPTEWPTAKCVWPAGRHGVPGPTSYYYDRNTLTGVLGDIINLVHPTVIRTLDPNPYERCANGDPTCSQGYDYSFDNLDHQAVARFVREILPSYGKHKATINYIGYSIADYQGDLGGFDFASKESIVDAYGEHDGNYQKFRDGYLAWFGAQYERYPSNATWLQPLSDGRLAAFGVNADKLVMWKELAIGGAWKGPISLNTNIQDGSVAPSIAVATRPNGRLQLFFLRIPQAPMSGTPEICTLPQRPKGDAFGPMTCLGSPSRINPDWVFVPATTVGADGKMWVFVRNDEGGVSVNHETDSGWTGWTDMPSSDAFGGGQDVVDGIIARQGADGRVHVFAPTRFGYIRQWYQDGANGPWVYVPTFPANAPVFQSHSLGVGRNSDGRLEVFYRNSGFSQVLSVREQWPGGPWGDPTLLFGDAGHGPISVVRHPGGELGIFELNTWGGVSQTYEDSPTGNFILQWRLLDGNLIYFPSAAIDGLGRAVVAGFAIDGTLYIRRQAAAGASQGFDNWIPAVSP